MEVVRRVAPEARVGPEAQVGPEARATPRLQVALTATGPERAPKVSPVRAVRRGRPVGAAEPRVRPAGVAWRDVEPLWAPPAAAS